MSLAETWLYAVLLEEALEAPAPALPSHDILPPADPGYPGVIPLPPDTWAIPGDVSDADWAVQNRKINDLLMRGIAP